MNYFDILWSQRFGGGGFTPHERSMLKALTENPENHNGIYRGKDLTNIYTIEQIYERVHDGSFEDLYLGDYFTVHLTTDLYTRFTGAAFVAGTTYYEMDNGTDVTLRTWTETQDAEPQDGKVYATKQVVEEDVDYMIAGFDLYLNFGEAGEGMTVTDHHIVMMPKKYYKTVAKMHHAYELTGYAGSNMHNITLPCYAASTKTALNNHVIRRRTSLNGTVDPNVLSMAGGGYMGGTTVSSKQWAYMQLLNEVMWTGTTVQSSSWREVGLDHEKLPIFNYMNLQELYGQDTASIWLRNVSLVQNGGVYYIVAGLYGIVSAFNAMADHYVLPFFLFG